MKLEFGEKRCKQVGRTQAVAFSFGFYPFFPVIAQRSFLGIFIFHGQLSETPMALFKFKFVCFRRDSERTVRLLATAMLSPYNTQIGSQKPSIGSPSCPTYTLPSNKPPTPDKLLFNIILLNPDFQTMIRIYFTNLFFQQTFHLIYFF